MSRISRRRFIQDSTAAAAGMAVLAGPGTPAAAAGEAFSSRWPEFRDRIWLGPEYWANPLQDWRLAAGRIECVHAAPDRNVHLLTHQAGARNGDLRLSVRVGRVEGGPFGKGKGSCGFRIGIMGPLREYRNSLVFGTGLNAGITADGGLFIGELESARPGTVALEGEAVELRLTAEPGADGCTVTLAAHDPADGRLLGRVARENVPPERLTGNVALVANFGRPPQPG